MSIVDKIKEQAKKQGTNKAKFLYFKEGSKVRIRFLQEFDAGLEIPWHDSFALSVDVPCQIIFDRHCDHCDNEDLRTRSKFAWSVWDYEAKEVKIILFAVNNCTPIMALAGVYEAYGTILDRDYVLTKTGKQQNTSFAVIAMDKVKFRNDKAKPYGKAKFLELLNKAFPDDAVAEDEDNEDDEDVEEVPKKKVKGKVASKKKPPVEDDDEEDEEEEAPVKAKPKPKKKSQPVESDYEDMSALELFKECKSRGIDVKPKRPEDYYIDKLEESDAKENEDDDDEDWEG